MYLCVNYSIQCLSIFLTAKYKWHQFDAVPKDLGITDSACDTYCITYDLTIIYNDCTHNIYVKYTWINLNYVKWTLDPSMYDTHIIIHKKRLNKSCIACPLEIVFRETGDNLNTIVTNISNALHASNYVNISSNGASRNYKIISPR